MFKKILCAVDGSDHAVKAADLAAKMAAASKAKLTYITVTKELKMTEEVKRYIEVEHLSGTPQYVLDEYTEKVIQKAKDEARAEGVTDVSAEIKVGNPARVIVDFAKRGRQVVWELQMERIEIAHVEKAAYFERRNERKTNRQINAQHSINHRLDVGTIAE